jgi:hypothetical protein
MVVVIKRSDSVSVLSGQVGPTDRDIWQSCIETLAVDLLIPLVQVHGLDGFTRVSVASAEKNDRDGNCGDRDLEKAAHLKRVVGVSFGRNSTDVLFEWAAKKSVLMGSRSRVSEIAAGSIPVTSPIPERLACSFGERLSQS